MLQSEWKFEIIWAKILFVSMGEFDGGKDEVARSKKHHPSAVRFPLGLNQANSTTEFALLSRARHNHMPDSYFLWVKKKKKRKDNAFR